ncbi:MAG TPA: TolC family protein [Pyrinomonadaceae bacterium]|nr:TolC family protein [Pyrinomonadaceae bacterium]
MSAFGNNSKTPRHGNQRSKAKASKPNAATQAAAKPAAESAQAAKSPAAAETSKSPFRKTGEPFLVLTADTRTQTPAQTPPTQTPAQRDATRPPGTEQRQTVPPTARPNNPQDPTAPPGTQRPSPQTPPSVSEPPRDTRTTPVPTQTPTTTATPTTTETPATETPTTELPSLQDITEPDFPVVQPRPVPPMPSLQRVGVISGDTLPLTLNEAIRRALENNNEIEVARNDVRLAESQLNALHGVFDPVLTYTPEINNSVRPVTNIFGGANNSGTVATTDINNNVSVTKYFGKGGGNYTYFFNNTREKTSASNITLNPFHSANQGVTFTQPLWRNRSIDLNRQQIRIQRKRLEQSDADFRRSTIDVISRVQRAYWDLVFALRDEQNQTANLNLARENFRRTEASVAAGAVAPLERAEIQTELSNRESALLLATQGVTLAENNLKNLMLKDPLAPEWTRVILPTDNPTFDDAPVSLDDALKEARANRQELRRLKLQEEISDIDLQYFKNQTKPRIDLTGTLSTTGLAGTRNVTTPDPVPLIDVDAADRDPDAFLLNQINILRGSPVNVPIVQPQTGTVPPQFVGGYGRTLANLFSLDTRNIVVGVAIEVPFRNRRAEANLATARIQRDQLAAQTRSQDQVIEVEVRNAVQVVETSRRRVLSARQARASAEEQLAGERRLYQVGRSTTFILFQRENALVNARNAELRAETDYNKALADLQRATSTTLRANNVIVETPVDTAFRD